MLQSLSKFVMPTSGTDIKLVVVASTQEDTTWIITKVLGTATLCRSLTPLSRGRNEPYPPEELSDFQETRPDLELYLNSVCHFAEISNLYNQHMSLHKSRTVALANWIINPTY